MIRLVKVEFQSGHGASDSNERVMVVTGSLKELLDRDDFAGWRRFKGVREPWREQREEEDRGHQA